MIDTEQLNAAVAARLAHIRKKLEPSLTQIEWAKKHGFGNTQVSNWETGLRRIPVECAEVLCGAYGLTLDYIYLGKGEGLSARVSKIL